MHSVVAKLRQIAPTSASVLITGESGTGKELVAKALHINSPRKNKPFVPLNCAELSENVLESELFGHVKGAFTGADRDRIGRFQYANGGTLFLDEIGDMPISIQVKLLRVLETGEIVRVGTNEPIKVNVRLISATNRDLADAIAEGKFRQDLYHRLKVVSVKLPPLRERRDDIPLLIDYFLKEFTDLARQDDHGDHAGRAQGPDGLFVAGQRPRAEEHDREHGRDRRRRRARPRRPDRRPPGRPRPAAGATGHAGVDTLVGKSLEEIEKHYIIETLKLTSGNREEAARLLGIGERTLYRKIKEYQIG